MEIGKRVMQILKISYCPYFHDRRHFCTLERYAVVTQHLTPRLILTSVRHIVTCCSKEKNALHCLNTKHSDFNKVFVNLLSGEPINIA